MSAWAAPLRHGALKWTRTRPSGSAWTASCAKGGPEHVPADALQLLAVATVDGRRGVQLHAEGRHRQRRPGRGLRRWRQVRAGERELDARRQRGVEVEVVDLGDGGDGLVDLREHGLHPLRGRRRRRQEAHVGDALVERPIGDEAM